MTLKIECQLCIVQYDDIEATYTIPTFDNPDDYAKHILEEHVGDSREIWAKNHLVWRETHDLLGNEIPHNGKKHVNELIQTKETVAVADKTIDTAINKAKEADNDEIPDEVREALTHSHQQPEKPQIQFTSKEDEVIYLEKRLKELIGERTQPTIDVNADWEDALEYQINPKSAKSKTKQPQKHGWLFRLFFGTPRPK